MLTEDFLGRAALVCVFTVLLVLGVAPLFTHFLNDSSSTHMLAIAVQVVTTAFVTLQIALTVARLPPKGTAKGMEPRISAIAGTFMILCAMYLTPAQDSEAIQMVALYFVLVGTATSAFCLYWLGRSFSLMATARRLVTTGPYAVVRHPLYVCEAIFVAGMIISHFSLLMLALGALQFALQYRRALNEEAILRDTFPEYVEYANRVPMLVPRLFGASKVVDA